jgi:uncharacterized protein (TIGR03435 family)
MKTIHLLLLLSGLAFGQAVAPGCSAISPDAAKRKFDVASVKRAERLAPPFARNAFATTGGPATNDPGRFAAAHTSLSSLIMRAWGIDGGDRLKAPSWLNNPVENGYAISATLPAPTTQEQFCGMLRNLLTERLHLTFHYEKQPRPGYELTVMPGGPKFKEFVPGPATPGEGYNSDTGINPFAQMRALGSDATGFPNLSPSQPTGLATNNSRTGATKESFRNNMAAFALRLAALINQLDGTAGVGLPLPRVVDKTGLAGIYDIRIEHAGIPFPNLAPGGDPAPAASDPVDAGPNIFNAVQQQLGLKLTKVADVQVDVMIIDHVDQTPTEN